MAQTGYLIDIEDTIAHEHEHVHVHVHVHVQEIIAAPQVAAKKHNHHALIFIIIGTIGLLMLVLGYIQQLHKQDYPEFAHKIYIYTYGTLIFNYGILVVFTTYAVLFESDARTLVALVAKVHIKITYTVRAVFAVAFCVYIPYNGMPPSIPFLLGYEAFIFTPMLIKLCTTLTTSSL